MKSHQQRLQQARPSVDTSQPTCSKLGHMRRNLKREQQKKGARRLLRVACMRHG